MEKDIKQVRELLIDKFSFRADKVPHNPNNEEWEGVHFRVLIENNSTKLREYFYFTVGKLHPLVRPKKWGELPVRNQSFNAFVGVISSVYLDRDYTDIETLIEDLGYQYSQAKKISLAIENNNNKAISVGIFKEIDALNEDLKELLIEGYVEEYTDKLKYKIINN